MTYEVGDKVLIAGTVVEAPGDGTYRVATTTGTGFWWSPDDLTPAEPEVDLTDQDRKELEAALAKVKDGDDVSVVVECNGRRSDVSGPAWENGVVLCFGTGDSLRHSDGDPGSFVRRLLSHTPAPKPKPYAVGADQLGRPDPSVPVHGDVVVDANGMQWTFAGVGGYAWASVEGGWAPHDGLTGPLTLTHTAVPVGGAA